MEENINIYLFIFKVSKGEASIDDYRSFGINNVIDYNIHYLNVRIKYINVLTLSDVEKMVKEILDNIKKYNAVWHPSHGLFYPVINNMLKEGLIKYAYEYDSRKYYAITDIGKDYYNARVQVFKDMLLQSSNFYLNIAKTLPTNAVV